MLQDKTSSSLASFELVMVFQSSRSERRERGKDAVRERMEEDEEE